MTSRPDLVHVYKDKAGGWRWRRLSPNGAIIADSGESYTRRYSATRAATRSNPGCVITN